jgi:hypothetical protein
LKLTCSRRSNGPEASQDQAKGEPPISTPAARDGPLLSREIGDAPPKMPQHHWNIRRSHPEVLTGFVESEQAKWRERQSEKAHAPMRRARLQDHRRQADAPPTQAGADQSAILIPTPSNVIGNPFAFGWGEFRHHYQWQPREKSFELFQSLRDDRVRPGSKQYLDRAQISW